MCAVRLAIDSLGPMSSADLRFDDLTVLTGPQASGKSVALQLLKLVLDRVGDPHVLRAFSADVHDVVQKALSADGPIFPRPQRFSEALRSVVASNVIASWDLRVEAAGLEQRFVLVDPVTPDAPRLPFLTWSAGQREFVPLLLGLYRSMPAGSRPRCGRLGGHPADARPGA